MSKCSLVYETAHAMITGLLFTFYRGQFYLLSFQNGMFDADVAIFYVTTDKITDEDLIVLKPNDDRTIFYVITYKITDEHLTVLKPLFDCFK